MQSTPQKNPPVFLSVLKMLRASHWIKNGFVAVPIIFAKRYDSLQSWVDVALAVAAFCLVSSGVYIFNDLRDCQADKLHPVKKLRPIPAGLVSGHFAVAMMILVVCAGFAVSWICAMQSAPGPAQIFDGFGVTVWLGIYFLLQLCYSAGLKNVAILDVIILALGFVLRALAGAAAISVSISGWLILCTFTLCLYLAIAKRRGELDVLSKKLAGKTRPALKAYDNPAELDRMLTVSQALAIISYSLYCLAPRTVQNIGSTNMIWTVPLVLLGIFRYDRVARMMHSSDVVHVVLKDRVLWIIVAAYIALAIAIIKLGSHPFVNNMIS